jgi:hypothetical protein
MEAAVTFKIDPQAMERWAQAWKRFPYEAGKWTAKMVNDMAFRFRDDFFAVIAARYTIRDEEFIRRTVVVEKARPRSRLEDISATIGTWQGRTGKTFSGYEEEITGHVAGESAPKRRVILPKGREGWTMKGKALPHARMNPKRNIPSIIDASLQNIPEESRFSAMVRMMGSGRIPHSPENVFILQGGKYRPGLYRFAGGYLPRGGQSPREFGLEMLQVFTDKPVMPPKWDWRGVTAEKVQEKFTPDYIFANYIAKAILGIMPDKGK